MRIELSCWLPRTPEWVWEQVQKSETLDFVAAPMIRFVPKSGSFPAIWTAGNHEASMLLFGILPLGRQRIGIEYPESSDPMVMRDNGGGAMVNTWDHWMFVSAHNGGSRYTDRVDVSAGALTPFAALFARIFYAHRQRRWQKLSMMNKPASQ
ncbi:MAG: hypothetical protein ACK5NN_07950 [Sphingomonadaceae bacterium]